MILDFLAKIFNKINDGRKYIVGKFKSHISDEKRVQDYFRMRKKRLKINNEIA